MDEPEFEAVRVPLGVALAGLPQDAPSRSAWPAMAARLANKRAPRRRWPLALAASLLALALLPRGGDPGGSEATADAAKASQAEQKQQLAALMSESARLERLIDAASDQGASSGTATAVSLALEDKLSALDANLETNPDAAQTLPLWQQRVELMRNIAAIEASRRYLASEGGNLDVALVSAY
jgi:hypothetical protein